MALINPLDATELKAGRASTLIPQIMATRSPGVRFSEADGVTAYYEPFGNVVSATGAPTVGDLQFVPMYSGAGGVLSEIGFNVTTVAGANGVARCGLYTADATLLQPLTLIIDGGEFATDGATGLKNTTGLSIQLDPDTFYFTAYICGVSSATVTQVNSGLHIYGRSATLAAQFGRIKTGFGYGALPKTAPTSLVFMTSTPAMVVHRWKSYNR